VVVEEEAAFVEAIEVVVVEAIEVVVVEAVVAVSKMLFLILTAQFHLGHIGLIMQQSIFTKNDILSRFPPN
jgi:hypothetical protein